jgi:hypothetical protein
MKLSTFYPISKFGTSYGISFGILELNYNLSIKLHTLI